MAFTTITVKGRFLEEDGVTPARGTVTFTLSAALQDPATDTVVAPVPERVKLVAGEIAAPLTATNDPGIEPLGVTYHVVEEIRGADVREYEMELDYESPGGEMQLADVVPVHLVPLFSYLLVATFNAHLVDPSGAHDLTAIGFPVTAGFAATTAYDALVEVSDELEDHEAATTGVHGIADTSELIVEGDARLSDARALKAPTAPVSFNGQRATTLADPTQAQDAATKAYVDAVAQGLDAKASSRLASTAPLDLNGLDVVDGVQTVAGDRVLVKDQADATTNGIYVVAVGAWARAGDADTSAKLNAGAYTFIEEGTANANGGFTLISDNPIVLGTSPQSWQQFSGAGQVLPGAGLLKTGNTLFVDFGAAAGKVVEGNDARFATIATFMSSAGQAGGLATLDGSSVVAQAPALHTDSRHSDGPNTKAKGGGLETFAAVLVSGAAQTIDLANGNLHDVTLSATCTFTFTGATSGKGCAFTLILRQDVTGGRGVVWPPALQWAGGTPPVLSTGASKVAVLTFVTVDGGSTWLGFLSGDDIR